MGQGDGSEANWLSPRGDSSGIPPASPDPSKPALQADAVPSLRGVHILVVDDEPDARRIVESILADQDAQVFTAASAAEALQMLDRQRLPDVLVSDIGMPGMDGYELIRAIRQRAADRGGAVPAIALTAFVRPEDRQRALRAGFDVHLPKPIDVDGIIRIVARLANRSH